MAFAPFWISNRHLTSVASKHNLSSSLFQRHTIKAMFVYLSSSAGRATACGTSYRAIGIVGKPLPRLPQQDLRMALDVQLSRCRCTTTLTHSEGKTDTRARCRATLLQSYRQRWHADWTRNNTRYTSDQPHRACFLRRPHLPSALCEARFPSSSFPVNPFSRLFRRTPADIPSPSTFLTPSPAASVDKPLSMNTAAAVLVAGCLSSMADSRTLNGMEGSSTETQAAKTCSAEVEAKFDVRSRNVEARKTTSDQYGALDTS